MSSHSTASIESQRRQNTWQQLSSLLDSEIRSMRTKLADCAMLKRAESLSTELSKLEQEIRAGINNYSISDGGYILNRLSNIKQEVVKVETEKKLLEKENEKLRDDIKNNLDTIASNLNAMSKLDGFGSEVQKFRNELSKEKEIFYLDKKNEFLKTLHPQVSKLKKAYDYVDKEMGAKDFEKEKEILKRAYVTSPQGIINNKAEISLKKEEMLNEIKHKIEMIQLMNKQKYQELKEKFESYSQSSSFEEVKLFDKKVKLEYTKAKNDVDQAIYFKSELDKLIGGIRLNDILQQEVEDFYAKESVTKEEYEKLVDKVEEYKEISGKLLDNEKIKEMTEALEKLGYRFLQEERDHVEKLMDHEKVLIELPDDYKVIMFINKNGKLVMNLIRVTDQPKDVEKDREATENWCGSLDRFLEELKKRGFEIKELKKEISNVDYWNLEELKKALHIENVNATVVEESKISIEENEEKDEYLDDYRNRYKKSEHRVMQQKLNS
ncbi:MAG TPA: hypothetical protein PLQ59_02365 [Fervidobacterium sp.]|nr:hypothetical protein [Fervidobacterium sp.]HQO04879.1 hypothetical protein [Fervidobacterium sp.]HQQ17256.1 hypothetical protein [Fervidobacterium sp.]